MSGSGLTVLLTKGSGMVLTYSNPDSSGYLTPQDLDRNALQQMDDGTFVETQPDGFQLYYGQSSSSSSSRSSGLPASAKSTSNRTAIAMGGVRSCPGTISLRGTLTKPAFSRSRVPIVSCFCWPV